MHKALLCHYSPYYKAALGGQYSETETGLKPIDTVNADESGTFVAWLYSGFLDVNPDGDWIDQCFHLYVYADEVNVIAFRDDLIHSSWVYYYGIMTTTLKAMLPSCDQINYLFDKLPSQSPLYSFLVSYYAAFLASTTQKDDVHSGSYADSSALSYAGRLTCLLTVPMHSSLTRVLASIPGYFSPESSTAVLSMWRQFQ